MGLIDPSQNDRFQDNFYSGVGFDLSKALFIFSLNDYKIINKILNDRIMMVHMDGYKINEKIMICKKYLIPKILANIGIPKGDICEIPDELLKYIIEKYAPDEEGVRKVKECLHTIYSKINLYRHIDIPDQPTLLLSLSFPLTITKDIITKLLENYMDSKNNVNMTSMYI